MPTIDNTTTVFVKSETEDTRLTRAEVLALVVGAVPPDVGATYSEIYKRTKILECLEASNGQIEFTDKQLDTVRDAFRIHRWPLVSKDIVELGEALGVEVE